MKKYRMFALLLALLLLLTACTKPAGTPETPDAPEAPPVTEPEIPAEPETPVEPEQPETPDQPEEPALPEEPEVDHKAAYEKLLAGLKYQGIDHIEMTGWGNTYLVSSEKGLKDVVYILQKLTLTEPADPLAPGAITLTMDLFMKGGDQFRVTLPAFSMVPAGETAQVHYAYDYNGDVFAGLMDIAAYEGNEEPFVVPLEGGWHPWTEAGEETVVIDEKGENIRLTAQEDMAEVKLYRASYDAATGISQNEDLLHEFGDVEKGEVLDFLAESPKTTPNLALEWTDTFGYRTRWLILPIKLFTAGADSNQVQLIYDRGSTQPQMLAQRLAPAGVTSLGKTDPYKYMTSEAKQSCVTEVVLEQQIDLDGNGRKNTVQLLYVHDPKGETSEIFDPDYYSGPLSEGRFAVRVLSGSARYDSSRTFGYNVSLFLADMNSDGNMEIYFSGDLGSDDYATRGYHLAAGGLEEVQFWGDLCRPLHFDQPDAGINGEVTAISGDGLMTIRTYVHMLGSHFATQVYSAERDGTLSPFPGSKWTAESAWTLKVKKALPVTLEGKASTLPVGTELKITHLGENRAYFTSSAGTGHIDLEYRERTDLDVFAWWWIDDVPETDYFEMLPYVG